MAKTWLIFDSNYLCHRAFYALGDLRHDGAMTGMTFGVLKDILHLQDYFNTKDIIFCFDRGQGGHRVDLCPNYKVSRRLREERMDDDEREGLAEFRNEVRRLRTKYLPYIGFRNIFSEPGYEADDIIATTVLDLPREDSKIIVSADKDLYQLLSNKRNTIVYHPAQQRPVTYASFIKEWGIKPNQWPYVKAIAGCETDDVTGIKGVGEKIAAKYLRGVLNPDTATYKKIKEFKGWKKNLGLVKLPYPGCPVFACRPDCVTRERWAALADRLGMSTIRNLPDCMRREGFGLNHGKRRRS